MFYPNTHVLIIADTRENAEKIFLTKVKYPFEHIDSAIKQHLPKATQDSAKSYNFSNGSSYTVGSSGRSGTFQRVHVSELGPICALYPEKAEEIMTGTLNAVHVAEGAQASIESTAMGNYGYFYDICMDSYRKRQQKEKLTPFDYRFFFFPWYYEPANILDPEGIEIEKEFIEYFDMLERREDAKNFDGSPLRLNQKVWYFKKAVQMKRKIKQEHPSTPLEAFESSVKGVIFEHEIAEVYRDGRVADYTIFDKDLEVQTYWDIGRDSTVIWFMQHDHEDFHRVINVYKAKMHDLLHYSNVIKKYANEFGYNYNRHVGPHDLTVRAINAKESRLETLHRNNIKIEVCPRISIEDKIESASGFFRKCIFQLATTKIGLNHLSRYRYQIKDKTKTDDEDVTFSSKPLHDVSSHYADAFMVASVSHDERYRINQKIRRTTIR